MSAERAVRIVTEVAAVDRPFDYLVTERTANVGVGDRVRVDFNHRSVRGWVIGDVDSTSELKPLTKWLGFGPPPSMLALLRWASERWYSPLSRFLLASSPKHLVTSLPTAPKAAALAQSTLVDVTDVAPGVLEGRAHDRSVALILSAYEACREREGSLLVLVPTESWAQRLRGRLEQRGCAVAMGESQWDRMRAGWPVVVGPRGAALAAVPIVSGAIIIDADDESLSLAGSSDVGRGDVVARTVSARRRPVVVYVEPALSVVAPTTNRISSVGPGERGVAPRGRGRSTPQRPSRWRPLARSVVGRPPRARGPRTCGRRRRTATTWHGAPSGLSKVRRVGAVWRVWPG